MSIKLPDIRCPTDVLPPIPPPTHSLNHRLVIPQQQLRATSNHHRLSTTTRAPEPIIILALNKWWAICIKYVWHTRGNVTGAGRCGMRKKKRWSRLMWGSAATFSVLCISFLLPASGRCDRSRCRATGHANTLPMLDLLEDRGSATDTRYRRQPGSRPPTGIVDDYDCQRSKSEQRDVRRRMEWHTMEKEKKKVDNEYGNIWSERKKGNKETKANSVEMFIINFLFCNSATNFSIFFFSCTQ